MRHKISVKLGHSWFFLAVQAKTFIWTSCLSLNQFMYFFISYQYHHKISFSCSKNQILSMVDASHSAHYIVSATGVHASTMSRLCSRKHSELKKSTSGCQTKISPPNTRSTIHLISIYKAENAVQMTKTLGNIINKPPSSNTACL